MSDTDGTDDITTDAEETTPEPDDSGDIAEDVATEEASTEPETVAEHPETTPGAPAGWYPTPDGNQRYWDGTAWTDHIAPRSSMGDDKTMAVLAHILGFVVSFIGPLVIWLVKKDESEFVREHSLEALNFQITVMIAYIVAGFATLILIGFLMLPVIAIISIIFAIQAAIAAGRGDSYRYPINIRMIT